MREEIERLFTAKGRREISLSFLTNVSLLSNVFKSNRVQYDLFIFLTASRQTDRWVTFFFLSRTNEPTNEVRKKKKTQAINFNCPSRREERRQERTNVMEESRVCLFDLYEKYLPTLFLFSTFYEMSDVVFRGCNRWLGCLAARFPHSPFPQLSLSLSPSHTHDTWHRTTTLPDAFYFVSPLFEREREKRLSRVCDVNHR